MNKLEELKINGCCVLKNVLPKELLEKSIALSNFALQSITSEHRKLNKSQGSMVHIADYPQLL